MKTFLYQQRAPRATGMDHANAGHAVDRNTGGPKTVTGSSQTGSSAFAPAG